jgi:transcriptional repressor OPI1
VVLVRRADLRHVALTAEPVFDDARVSRVAASRTGGGPVPDTETTEPGQANPNANAAWQSRLIMSTSGLSVAMSDESLRSLKYCLKWLRWANEHIGGVVGTLKVTLEQYEQPEKSDSQAESTDTSGDIALAEAQPEKTPEETREELATRINTLKGDVLKTLRDAINMVSRYAGGALPENARVLVRRHLTSLPQRFRIATMTDGSAQHTAPGSSADRDSAVRESAQKVLVLAKEGLDMVSQVSGVLDGTIVSAEEWCERMGKKRRGRDSRELQNQPVLPQVEPNNDVKMG